MKKNIIRFTACLLVASIAVSSAGIPIKAAKKASVKTKKVTMQVGKKKTISLKNKKKKAVYAFKSKNVKIVKVSKKGVMTARKTGKTKISVKEKLGKKTKNIGTVTVTVKDASADKKKPQPTQPAAQTAQPPAVQTAAATPAAPTAPASTDLPEPTVAPPSPIYPVIKDTPEKLNRRLDGVEYGEQITTTYYSKTTGKNRNAIIILPPGYTDEKKYPVLYLFHGGMGDENDWTGGGIRYMIGNMIADGEAEEMIVVLPNCRCREDDSAANADGFAAGHVQSFDNFLNDFRDNLMPFMEANYSVATGRENTAVAGLSMGGRVSLNIGITLADRVGYTGAFSPAYGIFPYSANGLTEEGLFTEETFTLPEEYNNLSLIHISEPTRRP